MTNMIRKFALTAFTIIAVSLAALSSGTTDAQAGGWKKFKGYNHYYGGYHYNYKKFGGYKARYYGGKKFKFKRGFKRKFKRGFRKGRR